MGPDRGGWREARQRPWRATAGKVAEAEQEAGSGAGSGGLGEGGEQEEVRQRRGSGVEGERAVPSATVKFTGVCQDCSPF